MVLGILHAHGGGLVVTTSTGRNSGSSFRVFLPVSAEHVAHPPVVAVAQRPGDPWGGTALVIEDDEPLRRATKAVLRHVGFSVLDAKDGSEGVEVFRRHRGVIRLVVCDLTMPRMGGWETLSALRALSPGLPVILTSGYDEAHVMAEGHTEKPQAFLSKPYQLDALRAAIRQALGTGPA